MFRFVRHITSFEGFDAGSSSRFPRLVPRATRFGMGGSKVAITLVEGSKGH